MISLKQAEIDLIDRCVLRCAHCSTASPYLGSRIYDLEEFGRDIFALEKVLHIENLAFVGGEPFLVTNIAEYASVLRESGICDNVYVVTNGFALEQIDPSVLTLFDWIMVSRYEDSPEWLGRVNRGIRRCSAIMPPDAVRVVNKSLFFKTEFHGRIDDEQMLARIWNECWQKNIFSICDGYVYRCATGQRRRRYLEVFDLSSDELQPEINGCAIHAPDLDVRLAEYLAQAQPFPMCRYCIGCSGKTIVHHQISEEEVENPQINTNILDLLGS